MQLISHSLDDGLQQLNQTCDLGEKVKQRSAPDGKVKVEKEVSEMKQGWEKLNSNITQYGARLDDKLVCLKI